MIVERLTIENFQCFAAEHTIELGPGITVVVGPNSSGKTALLESIAWCLYGADAVRRGKSEDDLVSDSQKYVRVRLDLSGGAYVDRRRTRSGKRTLEVFDGERRVDDRHAGAAVESLVGCDRSRFLGSVYVAQRAVDDLARARPAARRDLLLGQLDDGSWERLTERVEQRSRESRVSLDRVTAQLDEVEALVGQHRDEGDVVVDLDGCDEADESIVEHDRRVGRAERRAVLGQLLVELRGQISARPAERELPDLDERKRVLWAAQSDLDESTELGRSGFDGVCPVTRGTCPASESVVVQVGDVARRRREAESVRDEARRALSDVEAVHRDDRAVRRAAERDVDRWNGYIVELRTLGDVEPSSDPDDYQVALGRAGRRPDLVVELATVRASSAARERLRELRGREDETAQTARVSALLLRGVRAVPGPVAAARDEVEALANQLLASASASIRLEWESSSKAGAGRCGCGHRYRGTRRTCPECDVPRGQGRLDRVQVWVSSGGGREEPVESCGGLGDLACLALTLAATSVGGLVRIGFRLLDEVGVHLKGERLGQLGDLLTGLVDVGVDQVILSTNRDAVSGRWGRVFEVVAGEDGSRVVER